MKPKLKIITNLILLTLILLAGAIKPALAEDLRQQLNVKAEISTGQFLKPDSAVPVTIDIENNGGDFTGKAAIIDVTNTSTKEGDEYYQNINIPAHGKKRFFLYIPNMSRNIRYMGKLTVKISKGNDSLTLDVNPRITNEEDKVILILNKNKTGFSQLSSFNTQPAQNNYSTGNTGSIINISYPNPAALPIYREAYNGIDFILINDLPSLNLSQEQEEAILNYVRTGGTIIFSTNMDPNEYKNSIFNDKIPFKPKGSVQVHNQLIFRNPQTLLMGGEAKGDVIISADNCSNLAQTDNRTGHTIISAGNYPLVTAAQEGNGRIYFLAANYADNPFDNTYEIKALWTQLFQDIYKEKEKYSRTLPLDNLLTSTPETSLLPITTISWILLIYILLVGPITYMYLRKKDKMLSVFLIVPVLSIIFTLIIFALGFTSKGTGVIKRNITMVYISNGQDTGYAKTITSIFSPKHYDYDITIPDAANASAVYLEQYARYNDKNFTQVEEGENFTLKKQHIKMWSSKRYKIFKCKQFPGTIQLDVKYSANGFTGNIANNTGMEFENCLLFYNGSLSNPFNLKQGENTIGLSSTDVWRAGMKPGELFGSIKNTYSKTNLYNDKKNKITNDIDIICNNLSGEILRISQISNTPPPMVLIAWNRNNLDNIKLNSSVKKDQSLNLFFVRKY